MQSLETRKIRNRISLARDCLIGPPTRPMIHKVDGDSAVRKWIQNYRIHSHSPNLRFIHIGKCGGTTIMTEFLEKGFSLEQDHLRRPRHRPGWVFIWVRHPMTRFVSAFNFAKTLVDFDPSDLDPDKLSLENCPAPMRIRKKMIQGFTFTPEYDSLIKSVESANALAESLSSSKPSLSGQAEALLSHPQEHIAKGIGFYLSNGRWVERHHRRILMVGCLETMTQDFGRLVDMLGWEGFEHQSPAHRRMGSKGYSSDLSPTARRNLASRFQHTEYPALQALVAHGHLTRERLADYMQ